MRHFKGSTVHHGLIPTTALASCLAALLQSGPARADDRTWTISPYIWAADLGIDVSINDDEVGSTVIKFKDLLESIEAAGQLHIETRKGAHGVLLDVFYVQLADSEARSLPPNPVATFARFDSETTMSIAELAGVYDPGGDDRGVALKYGVRIVQQSLDIIAEFDRVAGGTADGTFSSDETLYDVMAGLRYAWPLTNRLRLLLGADVSTGGTDLTWSAGGFLSFEVGDTGRYRLDGGYRTMDIDFEEDNQVQVGQTLTGLGIGLSITF